MTFTLNMRYAVVVRTVGLYQVIESLSVCAFARVYIVNDEPVNRRIVVL
jgi:hypothetical protein